MSQHKIVLQVQPSISVSLTFADGALSIHKTTTPNNTKPSQHTHIASRYILNANFDDETKTLSISYVTKHKKNKHSHLVNIQGRVEGTKTIVAVEWVDHLMKCVYDDAGVKRSRRLMVFVNPFGGTGKAVMTFSQKIEPIFKAAGCSYKTLYTTHHGHAQEIAQSLPLEFDAVITVSGDGLVHEVFNGFAQHSNPTKAFSIPVAPIPTGSGNGLSVNILGLKDGFDVVIAALNAVKGRPMRVDLLSVTQNGQRSLSFMSQSLGLMADLDLGTEHLRWMGGTRFFYGLIRGIFQYKPCPVEISFKVVEKDKEKMVDIFQASTIPDAKDSLSSSSQDAHSLHPHHREEGTWTTFEEPMLYVYAGKGPYVSRDLMAFPVSLPDDGLLDIVIMKRSSRSDMFQAMDGAVDGTYYWHPKVHYVKASAYRVKPLAQKGYLSVDGEPYPFEEYEVEVLQGHANLLSPYGRYMASFGPRNTIGAKPSKGVSS